MVARSPVSTPFDFFLWESNKRKVFETLQTLVGFEKAFREVFAKTNRKMLKRITNIVLKNIELA